MPNTAKGLPYPVPTDPVASGAANIQALAAAVDGLLPARAGAVGPTGTIVRGTGFTVSHPGAGQYIVTFTPALSSIPILLLTGAGSAIFLAGATAFPTTAGFEIRTQAPAGTNADVNWNFLALLAI